MRKLIAALLIAVILVTIVSMSGFASDCAQIREDILRIHVLANSDSEEDQALKLQVRDRILEESAGLFEHMEDKQETMEQAQEWLPDLQAAAEDEIKKQGYDYPVTVELTHLYFSTRQYDSVTMPAGDYDAVRVLIGTGEGQNWWCVMFPPLCLPVAQDHKQLTDVLNASQMDIVQGGVKYEVKFKLVEWFEEIKAAVESWFA